MRRIVKRVPTLSSRAEDGATAVEYALLVSLIAVAIIVAVKALGTSVSGIFNTVKTSLG